MREEDAVTIPLLLYGATILQVSIALDLGHFCNL